ncbi:hypothetical protein [Bacillus sp. 22-7]|uniref:hypothetical protein n=1 Tax=Bacillus sp. 22-7 TaxID=2709707 RepID=UPI002570CF24|nr:hypothetical protein [Bacillus sp. 22-7]
MHKWILSFTACVMLSACSAGEEKKEEAAKNENSSQEYNEATNTEGKRSRSLLPSWMTGLMRV